MLEIDPYTILFTIINLLVLYLLMRKFLFGPVNAILDSRAKAIEDGLTQARQKKEEAEGRHSQYEAQRSQAREEAEAIVTQARTQGEAAYQRRITEAESRARQVLDEAAARDARSREQMLQSARQEVVALAMDAAAKAAGKLADSGCEEAIQAFLSEAGDAR